MQRDFETTDEMDVDFDTASIGEDFETEPLFVIQLSRGERKPVWHPAK